MSESDKTEDRAQQHLKQFHPGYLARNRKVAQVYGLNENLCNLRDKLKERQRTPLWLLEEIDKAIETSNSLIEPVVTHRDELKK